MPMRQDDNAQCYYNEDFEQHATDVGRTWMIEYIAQGNCLLYVNHLHGETDRCPNMESYTYSAYWGYRAYQILLKTEYNTNPENTDDCRCDFEKSSAGRSAWANDNYGSEGDNIVNQHFISTVGKKYYYTYGVQLTAPNNLVSSFKKPAQGNAIRYEWGVEREFNGNVIQIGAWFDDDTFLNAEGPNRQIGLQSYTKGSSGEEVPFKTYFVKQYPSNAIPHLQMRFTGTDFAGLLDEAIVTCAQDDTCEGVNLMNKRSEETHSSAYVTSIAISTNLLLSEGDDFIVYAFGNTDGEVKVPVELTAFIDYNLVTATAVEKTSGTYHVNLLVNSGECDTLAGDHDFESVDSNDYAGGCTAYHDGGGTETCCRSESVRSNAANPISCPQYGASKKYEWSCCNQAIWRQWWCEYPTKRYRYNSRETTVACSAANPCLVYEEPDLENLVSQDYCSSLLLFGMQSQNPPPTNAPKGCSVKEVGGTTYVFYSDPSAAAEPYPCGNDGWDCVEYGGVSEVTSDTQTMRLTVVYEAPSFLGSTSNTRTTTSLLTEANCNQLCQDENYFFAQTSADSCVCKKIMKTTDPSNVWEAGDCLPGFWKNEAEQYRSDCNPFCCETCGVGKYVDEGYQYTQVPCQDCPAGRIGVGIAAAHTNSNSHAYDKACFQCPPGRYVGTDQLTCEACGVGRYTPNSNRVCTDCPGGTYNDEKALDATTCKNCAAGNDYTKTSCTACAAGKYNNRITSNNNNNPCEKCDYNSYQDATGQSSCKDCGYSTTGCTNQRKHVHFGTNQIDGATSSSHCSVDVCGCGYYTNGGSFSGTRLATNSPKPTCSPCPAGKYGKNNNYFQTQSVHCTSCNSGANNYQDQTAQLSCKTCSAAGHVITMTNSNPPQATPDNGAKYCLACPVGRASQQTTRTLPCSDCQAGYYGDVVMNGITKESGSNNYVQCKTCANGNYLDANIKATSCTQCEKGKALLTSNAQDKTTCPSCALGKFVTSNGANSVAIGGVYCTDCANGKYNDDPVNDRTCKICGESFLNSGVTLTSLFHSHGLFKNGNGVGDGTTTGATHCTACPNGKGTTIKTSDIFLSWCENCPIGMYGVSGGGCEWCALGRFTSAAGEVGSSSCDEVCGAGSYGVDLDQAFGGDLNEPHKLGDDDDAIIVYGTKNYVDYSNMISVLVEDNICAVCPAGKYNDADDGGIETCNLCKKNQFVSADKTTCYDCPAGRGTVTSNSPHINNFLSTFPCSSGSLVGASETYSCYVCAEGYEADGYIGGYTFAFEPVDTCYQQGSINLLTVAMRQI